MEMEWASERNDSELWQLRGRNVERRPKPAPSELSTSLTDHVVINRSLTGSQSRISFDYGETFSDWSLDAPVAIATGPYYGYLMSHVAASEVSTTENAAINKALAKINDKQFDLGVFLGELPETIAFIHQGAQTILQDYVAAAKRADRADKSRARLRKKPPTRSNLKRINNLTNLIASIWLSYRYGVMPLYYALVDAVKTFEKGLNKARRVTVKTSAKQTVDGVYHEPESTQRGSVKVRVTLTADVTATMQTSLGLDNPALIAWELVPLSFVFDWFIDVGEFLTAFQPSGNTFVAGSISTKVDTQVERKAWTEVYMYLRIDRTAYSGYSQSYQRRVLTGLPNPRLYFKPNLNVQRYLDAFSLLKLLFFKADKYAVKN